MSVWSLVYKGFEPGEEGLREALCTLGNGYFATRGAGSESEADKIHYPGTYLAGGYNRLCTNLAGHEIENEDLVNLPNWLPLNFRIPGETWFNLMGVEILEYRQELDLRHGILFRAVYFQDHRGRRSRLTCRRLVHMAEPHSAAQEFMLVPENWSGEIEIISALDGRVVNAGVERYKELNGKHLDPVKSEVIDGETIYLEVMTNQSKIRIAEAARTRIFSDAEQMEFDGDSIEEPLYACRCFRAEVAKDRPLKAEKIVALFTSRDPAISEPGLEARKAVKRAKGFEDLYNSHALAWKHIWRRFDVDLDQSDPEEADRTETIIHLYTFHLLQTVSIQTTMAMDLDVGVPARGWHGEAYRGHILWDELFVFPIFNLRVPEITKELLLYRYRRLEEARVAARNKGYKGAMYPWQSGSNGREESQAIHLNPRSGRWIPDNSRLQRHVNSAIVYNAWQYFQVTGDTEFMYFFGAEMILEIARFWASKAAYNQDLGRYEIKGVMGPDEYHEGYPGAEEPGLNNNAYTNITAVWVLTRALGILESVLPEDRRRELRETLDLREEEIERWREISRKMFIPFHDEGIISQFDGYGRLEEFDWEGYRNKYGGSRDSIESWRPKGTPRIATRPRSRRMFSCSSFFFRPRS